MDLYIDLAANSTKDKNLNLYFGEKIDIPEKFLSRMVISHGFHQEITIQDFPLRDKTVYLHITPIYLYDAVYLRMGKQAYLETS